MAGQQRAADHGQPGKQGYHPVLRAPRGHSLHEWHRQTLPFRVD